MHLAACAPVYMSIHGPQPGIGVAMVAPLVHAPKPLKRGLAFAMVVLAVGVAASFLAAFEADRAARLRDEVRFERFADRLRAEIERRVNLYTYGLRGMAGLWLASERVERSEFAAMVSRWDLGVHFPGALGIAYIEAVPHERVHDFVRDARHSDPSFELNSSVAVSTHMVVRYIEPIERNRAALGFDVAVDEPRAGALWRAAATGEPTLSEPVELIQAPREGLGLVYVLAVYKAGVPLDTPAQRTEAVRGWISMPILVARAFGGLIEVVNGEVDVAVYGEHAHTESSVVFDSARRPGAMRVQGLQSREAMEAGGQQWTLRFTSAPSFTRASRAAVWALGATGCGLSLALACLVLSLATTAARARSLANRMTASLRESETRFRAMADAAPIMIWMTAADGKTTHLSTHWRQFTGLCDQELLGWGWLNLVHPDDAPTVQAVFERSLCERTAFEMEYRLRAHDGRYRWLVDRGVPRLDADGVVLGFVGGCMDITSRREAEQALSSERARLAAFVQHAPAAVAMFDRQMRYIAFSNRWLSEYRLEGRTLVGCSHYDVFPGMPDRWRQIHERCLAGAVERCEDDCWRPPGWTHDQHLRWEVRPWHEPDGSIGGIMMYTRDITAEIAVMKELADARRRAEAASVAKSGFLANMSHEIRTPMTAIMGFADLLDEEQAHPLSSAERSSALRTIKRNGQHLLALINDILDVSKIEAGKMSVEAIDTDPSAIVADVLALMLVRAAGKGLRLDTNFETPVPRTITSDPVRLKQILVNLVGNAIKFTDTGGVRVSVAFEASTPASPMLRMVVADTGIGMSPSQVRTLFSPFTQADETMTRRFGGTGLGLTICARLAEMLGGSITVQSTPGKGSEFTLRVSALNASDDLSRAPAPVRPDDEAGHGLSAQSRTLTGVRVLLAEDGPDNQRLIRFHLERAGAAVTTVDRGDDAVLLAAPDMAVGHSPFDLILMDMQMPGMDGYTASTMLRSRGCTTPIIAVTAHAMQGDREKCLAAGCDEYCTKPIERRTLLDACARLAARVRADAQ